MTPKQSRTKIYLSTFLAKKERMPTIREVMARFNLKSTASAWLRIETYRKNLDICPFCKKKL